MIAQSSRSRSASPSSASVAELGRVGIALAVVAGDQADQHQLARREPRQPGVEDQVVRVAVVVVVVDRRADVVQHARRPEQLALGVAQLVQPGLREPVEHLERQRPPRGRRGSGSALKRCARFSTDSRRTSSNSSPLAQQALEEDALAQAGLGHLDPLEAAAVEGGGQHERAAEDHVAAVGLDAGHVAALGRRPVGEPLDQLLERVARRARSPGRRAAAGRRASSPRRPGCGSCRRCRPGARRPPTSRARRARRRPSCAAPSPPWPTPSRRAGTPRSRAPSRAAATRPRRGGGPRAAASGCCRRRCRARSRRRSSWSWRSRASRSGPPRGR